MPKNPRRTPATARVRAVDVAARAGVSVATVSMVVNGKGAGRVSPATRDHVQQVIDDLGYVVHSTARSLATGRRQCVAFVAQDMANPFISMIASGVAATLGAGTQLLLSDGGGSGSRVEVQQALDFGVDGVLINFPWEQTAGAAEPDVPVVVMDDDSSGSSGLAHVYFDFRDGASRLAEHLVDLGHRRVRYLDSTRPWPTFQERRRRLVTALRQRGGSEVVVGRARSEMDIDAARLLVAASWPEWERDGVTAIVTASDIQAYGVLGALAELGVAVPGRVSVASFDDIQFSSITNPALTTVHLPAYELGAQSAALLQELMDGSNRAARTRLLATHLVVRASTGAAWRTGR